MSKLQVDYLGSNIVITSGTPIFKEFGELQGMEVVFEEMGEVDVVECNEINPNRERMFIDSERSIFLLGSKQEQELIETGRTVLNRIGDLADQIDTANTQHLDFLKWYYGTDDVQEAVQRMYEDCGWIVTDIDSFQAYKDLMPNHVENELLLFRENRYRPNIGDDADNPLQEWMCEMEVDYTKMTDDEKFEACGEFGYSNEEIQEWIDTENVPLICEYYFETS